MTRPQVNAVLVQRINRLLARSMTSKSALARREALIAYIMILPWVIGLVLFQLGPTLATAFFSLTRYNILKPPQFIGLDNYVEMFTQDPLFWQSLFNTVYFALLSVPSRMLVAFVLAYFLNSKIRGTSLYRTLYYMPYVVPTVAATVLWLWLLNRQYGLINYALGIVNLPPVPWLTTETWSKPALALINLWTIGGLMVIYLAALQGIPSELHDAVAVDGGTWWHKLVHVTIPMMTPTIFFTLVLSIIGTFQAFDTAFIITQGGPVNSTLFYMLHLYNRAFRDFEMGYASALAWILFLVVLGLTVILFRWSRFWVHYEGYEE